MSSGTALEEQRQQRRQATLNELVPMPDFTPASDVPRALVDRRMQHNNIRGALANALMASMAPELSRKLPSIYTSRQRNSYCACGKRGEDGRRMKFGECCGAGR